MACSSADKRSAATPRSSPRRSSLPVRASASMASTRARSSPSLNESDQVIVPRLASSHSRCETHGPPGGNRSTAGVSWDPRCSARPARVTRHPPAASWSLTQKQVWSVLPRKSREGLRDRLLVELKPALEPVPPTRTVARSSIDRHPGTAFRQDRCGALPICPRFVGVAAVDHWQDGCIRRMR